VAGGASGLDPADLWLFEEAGMAALYRVISLTPEQAGESPASELRGIQAVAQELNGDFVGMRKRLIDQGRLLAADSNAPSAG
jgi:hypothetical protein